MTDVDLLSIGRGAVVAPAGCGKTHKILTAAKDHRGPKPMLVLTHTNAGVAALRARLSRERVPPSRYRLATIDGWAMRLIRQFPARSGHDPDILDLRSPASDYPRIRQAAAALVAAGQLGDVLAATYDRLVVDEYQDCSAAQHQIVSGIAETVPTCVLGDPMQAIFGFGPDPLPAWSDVLLRFPLAAELAIPWRWRNAGAEELGAWLLEARTSLGSGDGVDLGAGPDSVTWVQLDGVHDDQLKRQAARSTLPGGGTVVVMGDSRRPESQRLMASQTPGAVAVESVDMRDLVEFASAFDASSPTALDQLLDFAASVTVNADIPDLKARVRTLRAGRSRTAASASESACVAFVDNPSHLAAADVLAGVARRPGVRVHRPSVFLSAERSLRSTDETEGALAANAVRERERSRMTGRTLPSRAIGSTLLLKGLEADIAVILEADGMDARNLYVALTRGAKRVIACSTRPVLCREVATRTLRRR